MESALSRRSSKDHRIVGDVGDIGDLGDSGDEMALAAALPNDVIGVVGVNTNGWCGVTPRIVARDPGVFGDVADLKEMGDMGCFPGVAGVIGDRGGDAKPLRGIEGD